MARMGMCRVSGSGLHISFFGLLFVFVMLLFLVLCNDVQPEEELLRRF